MYSYDDRIDDDVKTSQEIFDGDATLYGYRKSFTKRLIFYISNIIFCGIPYLLTCSFCQLGVRFRNSACPLNVSEIVLIKV